MSKSGSKSSKKSNEEIFAGFQALRTEQRQLGSKISELQMDLNEHKIVIETLRGVEAGRKCFRMVGGVLVERSVGVVLPELERNCEQLPRAVAALEDQLAAKGAEINAYIARHDIRIQRADAPAAHADGAHVDADHPAKSNVLVASA